MIKASQPTRQKIYLKSGRSLNSVVKDNLSSYAFMVPWLLGFFLLVLYPMGYSFYLSFTEFNLIRDPKWIGLNNFREMFTGIDFIGADGELYKYRDTRFMTSLWVTVKYVFLSVPAKLIFALAVAMLMSQKLRGIPLYRTIYYIPTLLGGSVAISVLWRQLFSSEGAINAIIRSVSNGALNPPSWISSPEFALYTLVLLSVWQFGSPMIIFLAGIKQIPTEYYEAASVDGAGKFKQFIFITLPCLSPIIFFNFIMQMIGAFQAFTQAYIISNGQGGPVDSTLFYSLYLYMRGFAQGYMGYASAMAWVLLVIIATFTFLAFKFSGRLVSYGSGE